MSRRVWFWAPQWHWFGWGALLPFHRGEDEHGRVTLVLGWTVTGRVVVALCECSNPLCVAYRETLAQQDAAVACSPCIVHT